jgi:hypothetical protein
MTVESLVVGTNADLMRSVAALYIEPDDVIVDATFGQGGFWRRLPDVAVVQHDLACDGVDLRSLPEADGSVDVLVLDPPYRLADGGARERRFLDRFGIVDAFTCDRAGRQAMVELYDDGIAEATRVLGPGGRLLVKCQDFVSSSILRPMVATVIGLLDKHGLAVVDLFVLASGAGPGGGGWRRQHRARRTHSYLVVASRSARWERQEPREREPGESRADSLW